MNNLTAPISLYKKLLVKRASGIFFRLIVYTLLTGLAFVFIYPFLHMITNAFKSYNDVSNITVKWLPHEPTFGNFKLAWEAMNVLRTGLNSIIVAVIATTGHVFGCACIAYGFARFRFPLRNVAFAIVIVSILVPTQTLIVPMYITYSNMKILDTFLPMILPSFVGFGLRGGIFIFLFRQYFIRIPKSLEEAANIDGCGPVRVFLRIALPSCGATLLVATILSLVWHWNDYYEPSLYLTSYDNFMLPQMLSMLSKLVSNMQTADLRGSGGSVASEEAAIIYHKGVTMAATVISLIPPFLLYSILQRRFMEGIERSGLVE